MQTFDCDRSGCVFCSFFKHGLKIHKSVAHSLFFGSGTKQTGNAMMHTITKINSREKRQRIDNATVEFPEHFLDCSHSSGTNCDQEIKNQISSYCLKITNNIQIDVLEACKSSERAGGSTIQHDSVRKSPRFR